MSVGNYRPHFYAIQDKNNLDIYWMIPISSQTEKYKAVIEKKKQRYGKCNTIVIGKFAGKENAFLIQNAFPIIEKYLDHIHTIQGKPVVVHKELNQILTKYLQDVLAMYDAGVKLLFADVQEIRRIMEKELTDMHYEEIVLQHLEELAALYVETFNAEPWNDEWTIDTAKKRLQQIINTEDSYGLCIYQNSLMCGAILGNMEQFYSGIMFNIKEFWIKNGMRGNGIGTQLFQELENRLKDKDVNEIILFTSKGDFTEHFYHKQNMKSNSDMVFMTKQL